jgi:hypothetical protein
MGANETLSFVPYPAPAYGQRPPSATSTLSSAIAKNSSELLDYTVQWVASAKTDPAAFEALADVLDVRGEIGDASAPSQSALAALQRARLLARDTATLLRISAKEAWIRFKRGEFGKARELADSALGRRTYEKADANFVVGLAALTGRVHILSRLSVISNAGLPADLEGADAGLKTAVGDFFARAALGACTAANASRANLDKAIDRYAAPAAKASMTRSILARPLSMLVPCTDGRSILELSAPPDRLSRLQRAFAEGNKPAYAALSDSIAERVRNRRPGDLSPDFVFQQSWLRSASGDLAGASKQLDQSLDALTGINGSTLREAGSAAAIVQAMELRAQLAAKQGDPTTARRWSKAVLVLWANADPELASNVSQMRLLAQ